MANIAAAKPLSHPAFLKSASISADLTQGIAALPRGAISEICGAESTGRTAVAHRMLATATLGAEICAWIDGSDAFDPVSARFAGADMSKLLWVQCGSRVEVVLKATDMILHSGGFGLIVLDLCDASDSDLRRVPFSYWYRLRNAIEPTPSVLLVLGREPIAKSCAVRQFALERKEIVWTGWPPFETMERFAVCATSRKPMGVEAAKLDFLAAIEEAV